MNLKLSKSNIFIVYHLNELFSKSPNSYIFKMQLKIVERAYRFRSLVTVLLYLVQAHFRGGSKLTYLVVPFVISE